MNFGEKTQKVPTVKSVHQASAALDHSKAFVNFVKQPDDLVGLLGYALYKRNINERKAANKTVAAQSERDPETTELDTYRGRAETLLRVFAEEVIESERAAIISEAIGGIVPAIATEIKSRTGFWTGVLIGIVAWLISIVLTIIVASSAPDWVAGVVKLITRKS